MSDRRASGAWLGAAACCGLLLASGCKNRQKGWPDRSEGRWGFVTWCDGDLAAEQRPEQQASDPFGIDETEPVCPPLADDIAVSATIHPGYTLSKELPNAVHGEAIDSASAEYLVLTSEGWVALREGEVGLLAIGTGTVLDYKMLALRLVDAIELETPELLAIHEALSVTATPMGNGNPLGGRLTWEWHAASDGIEVVSWRGNEAVIEITTQDPVTLEITAGGYTESLTLDPWPGPSRVPAGGGQ